MPKFADAVESSANKRMTQIGVNCSRILKGSPSLSSHQLIERIARRAPTDIFAWPFKLGGSPTLGGSGNNGPLQSVEPAVDVNYVFAFVGDTRKTGDEACGRLNRG